MRKAWIAMVAAVLAIVMVGLAGVPILAAQGGPNQPPPQPVTLDPATSAVLVLDLNERCADPAQVCSQLAPRVRPLLDKARAAGVYIIYTVSGNAIGTPLQPVWSGFDALPDEPVIYPDGLDKFQDGRGPSELGAMLEDRAIRTVVITGSSSNNAVLFTATGAARTYDLRVVIPYDGMNSVSTYQDEYTVHQLSVMPTANVNVSFTTIDMLQFAPGGM